MSKLALVAVGYNRINSLRRLLVSLNNAEYLGDQIDLYISIDRSDSNVVSDFAHSFQWLHGDKHVLTYSERLGLRKHILKCGDLLDYYDAIAMLEDDVVVSNGFYNYMKQAVEFYRDNKQVAGISLYANRWNEFACCPFTPMHSEYDTYFFQFAESRGQIWLKEQWKAFKEWYNSENTKLFQHDSLPKELCCWPETSWKKYHVKFCVDNDYYFVYPYVSFATCFSDFGTHTRRIDTFIQVDLYQGYNKRFRFPDISNNDAVFYDVFYERTNLKGYENCEFDLYGIKHLSDNKRYVISPRSLPYEIVAAYGAQMKPQEANVLMEVPGDDFYKYDKLCKKEKPSRRNKLRLFRYRFSLYDHSRELMLCILDSVISRIKKKLYIFRK